MSKLQDMMVTDLKRSGISKADAEFAGMYAVASADTVCPDFKPWPAIIMPYEQPLIDETMRYGDKEFVRVRYLDPPVAVSFIEQKPLRYGQPKDSGTRPYFPITETFDWQEIYDDSTIPIYITEGEKKALAACLEGFPTIGLGGVFNFMTEGEFLPEVAEINWKSRTAYICFDSDAAMNPQIQAAEGRLATELSQNQKAEIKLIRIPPGAGNDKMGIDDYLVEHGADAFAELADKAMPMRKIDNLVLELNKKICWVESEGMVYEHASKHFIVKANFTCGSKYSALETFVPTAKGDKMKRLSIAGEWLIHAHSERYNEILFHPGKGKVVQSPSGSNALNMWTGWGEVEGDVQPFLDLTEFLLQDTEKEARDLIIPMLAYKVQNPMEKVPFAIVIVGPQGCGKSFWCKIVKNTAAPYCSEIYPAALSSDFNPWVENTIFVVLNEATGPEMRKNAEKLKTLITEPETWMNDKFRRGRDVVTHTFFMITSNNREIAKFDGDDRRMIVVSAPTKANKELYKRVGAWYDRGGSAKLMHYLLNYDISDFEMPDEAPMTSEKYMAYIENLSPVQKVAEAIKTADDNVIKMWIDASTSWAVENELSANPSVARQAKEIVDSLSLIPIRPFYTAAELALMLPHVVERLHGNKAMKLTSSGLISRELRNNGVTYLRNADDPKGFRVRGIIEQYLVVTNKDEFSRPISQNEFDRLMREAPSYSQLEP